MKKNLILIMALLFLLIGCQNSGCKHENTTIEISGTEICENTITKFTYCNDCKKIVNTETITLEHDFYEERVEPTCSVDGYIETKCYKCNYNEKEIIDALGHREDDDYTILGEVKCREKIRYVLYCNVCHEELDSYEEVIQHDFYKEVTPATCSVDGKEIIRCHNCDYYMENTLRKTGHQYGDYIITREATKNLYGIKQRECSICGEKSEEIEYAYNTYSAFGELKVSGADLVNQENEKVQLIGISTHGLQWFGRYVNYDTFEALKDEFGINTIRLSMYTSEGGYCETSGETKEKLYQTVVKGIEYATELDMYVIVDWHMVGAVSVADKNPLTYVNESMEFFSRISKEFADNKNILYEIMNEPCGDTTWNDCKKYANQVIPCIRENTDAVVLVGNPRWSADLNSVMKDPLTGFTNIMYTYHFYANDHRSTTQVKTAYDSGFPVFISEHGGMNSDGNGSVNESAVKNWYSVLDERNISYVAWNLSNSQGDASILKYATVSMTDFSDEALKPWGIFYKKWTRTKAGLPL